MFSFPKNYLNRPCLRKESVRKFAQVLWDDVSEFPALREAERMMRTWSIVLGASVSWGLVHDGINALRPGETFCLYLRAQNAGITIQDHKDSATLAVFRVAAGANEVMEAAEELSVCFRATLSQPTRNAFGTKAFAIQVADLANREFVEMLPKSRKAGTDVPEPRDVADPSYLTTWLMSAVAGEST